MRYYYYYYCYYYYTYYTCPSTCPRYPRLFLSVCQSRKRTISNTLRLFYLSIRPVHLPRDSKADGEESNSSTIPPPPLNKTHSLHSLIPTVPLDQRISSHRNQPSDNRSSNVLTFPTVIPIGQNENVLVIPPADAHFTSSQLHCYITTIRRTAQLPVPTVLYSTPPRSLHPHNTLVVGYISSSTDLSFQLLFRSPSRRSHCSSSLSLPLPPSLSLHLRPTLTRSARQKRALHRRKPDLQGLP